ncbi:MAG: glutamine synthetase III [bacterium]|nr:glutamine synthetase III [Bacillota bacterium]HHW54579.1 glutamine synthetase type III [Bacillota bacterium]
MKDMPSYFGSMVFNETVMQTRLPPDIYNALQETITQGTPLDLDIADAVAKAMKEWALEKGASHFAHWFQPLTGATAEKHEGFISPGKDGRIIMEFSGQELLRGEPDASSFPSGGLRATCAARGYTLWDPSSYPFVKDGTLYIPTAFCSFNGEALDNKIPLLRSMDALNKQALRILRLFGNTGVKRVTATVGPEQEYFLIDKGVYLQRPDLLYTGRTLFGVMPPKGQEMQDHYLGSLKPRIAAFMRDLERELWKLGVPAKTKHNEVAPGQHELAPIYGSANIATEHNQLVMELMKTIAAKHGLACLLHEKPFAGINGSGKHVNWSMATDAGVNLLEPGETPAENLQFLLFLVAIIRAIDEYQDLLRASVASAGNDHRLGGHEAPPAIMSIFLGDELTEILKALETGAPYPGREKEQLQIGARVLPLIPKDTTDRNRTSPFAFTGNKFEFRMPGSALSIAGPNIVLNTIVAEVLREFADTLEQAGDFAGGLRTLIQRTIRQHKRVIFNGNNYADEWVREAERRGLTNRKTTVEALPALVAEKSIALFTRHRVFSATEIQTRYEIMLDNYCKTLHIEALTMAGMLQREIIPACISYQRELAQLLASKRSWGDLDYGLEESLLNDISQLCSSLHNKLAALKGAVEAAERERDALSRAQSYRDGVCTLMSELRVVVDGLERIVAQKHWPFPTYAEILHSIN